MIPKKLYVRKLDIDIFDEEVNATRAWVANRPNTGRREYTDLSQVWHPAEEEPDPYKDLLVENEKGGHAVHSWYNESYGWKTFAKIFQLKRWAYVEDLLPKGGDQ